MPMLAWFTEVRTRSGSCSSPHDALEGGIIVLNMK